VERDIKRTKRAERKLRKNLAATLREIAKKGGVETETSNGKPKVAGSLRILRELNKALGICLADLKSYNAERAALELVIKENESEYAL
jgi:hypothetical protein